MDKKGILSLVEKENIRFVRLQITDINGSLKNVELPARLTEKVLDDGIMFDGSSIDGFVRIEESDMHLRPDTKTMAVLPWHNGTDKTIRFICDVCLNDGTPFEGDPRFRLKKVIEKAAKMGFGAVVGPEPEFYLLKRDAQKLGSLDLLLDRGSYFDLLPVDGGEEIRKKTIIALEDMGFEVEAAHHEVGPSQHEIDFKYTEILNTADNIQTFKWVVKTIALMNNTYATFMPKPFYGEAGSGMHVNISLGSNGKNAFYDPEKSHGLSDVGIQFIGGVLKHAKEITAVLNPTVNSYKRLVPGFEAPVNISWALGNRSALIRIPAARGNGTRMELRNPDPMCNPYLALALILEAGLRGVEEGLTPPNPIDENIFAIKKSRRRELSIESMPTNLMEAVQLISESSLAKEVLGEHIFNKFIEMKKREWKSFMANVTDWELREYSELV